MSIVNIWLERGRALVAVDTLAEHDTRSVGGEYVHIESAKMIPLPHANMVLANRGDLVIFQGFLQVLLGEPVSWNVDIFAERAAAICDYLYRMRMDKQAALYEGRPFEDEIYAIGWSPRSKEVVAYVCCRGAGDDGFTITPIESFCAAPGALDVWPAVEDIPRFNTIESMITVAKEQVRCFRSQFPGRPIGGRLIVAEVRSWGIDIKEAAYLG